MNVYHCFQGGRFKALTTSYDDGRIEDERLPAITAHLTLWKRDSGYWILRQNNI